MATGQVRRVDLHSRMAPDALPGFRGWLLSIAAPFWLLRHFTEVSMHPGILLMVVVVSRMIWALIIFGFS